MPSSEVMHKFGKGTLKRPNGKRVTNQKEALAIMFSEKANEMAHGGKYTTKKGKH